MVQPIIGKGALESLTTGMYSNEFILYREYIQNSSDSFNKAFKCGILKKNEEAIRIEIEGSMIRISDNGIGIEKEKAISRLINIGDSDKDFKVDKGFRGIGRLAGISYCEKLIFITSCSGEDKKTVLEWDCKKLNELIAPGEHNNLTVAEVITEVTCSHLEDEEAEKHYFIVELHGVKKEVKDLLDEEKVKAYICEVAPIPFDKKKFSLANNIYSHFSQRHYAIDEYNIFMGNSRIPLTKKYKSYFDTSKGDDQLTDINFFESKNGAFVCWVGVSSFKGAVKNDIIKGIRVRKENILIGNEKNFSQFFPSEGDAANPWFIGELHILDKNIYPNARRDDFEKNSAYYEIHSELREICNDLNKNYRRMNSKINVDIRKLVESKEKLKEIERKITENDFTSKQDKEVTKKVLDKEIETVEKITKKLEKLENNKELLGSTKYRIKEALSKTESKKNEKETIDEISKAADKIKKEIEKKDFKFSKDLPANYSRSEKKLYYLLMETLFEKLEKEKAETVRTAFLEKVKNKKKK